MTKLTKSEASIVRNISVFTFVLVLLLVASVEPTEAAFSSTLWFPEEHSLGSVYTRLPLPEDSHYFSAAWKYIGLARGSVEIPAGHEVQLEISRTGLRYLGELRALGSNDLQCLILRDLNATDSVLTNVLHLSGLLAIRLSGNPITDHGARLLTNFPVLIDLNLSDTPVTDRGIADVVRIKSLRSLGRLRGRNLERFVGGDSPEVRMGVPILLHSGTSFTPKKCELL